MVNGHKTSKQTQHTYCSPTSVRFAQAHLNYSLRSQYANVSVLLHVYNNWLDAHVCLTVLPLSPLLAHSPKYVQYSQPILVHKNVCPVLEYITAPGSIWCWCLRFCFLLGWKSSSSKSITCDNTAIVCQLLEILDLLPMFSWTCHKQWCGNHSGIVVRLFSP